MRRGCFIALGLAAACASAGLLVACERATAPAPVPALAADPARHVRNEFFHREDAAVTSREPAPHEGTGMTTAYRYFDDVRDARVIFRKRALHPGASIGVHVLTHDEVYYVVSGQGELTVDDSKVTIGANSATFMREGAAVGVSTGRRCRSGADRVLSAAQ